MAKNNNEIGQRIKALRVSKGFTLEKLGELANTTAGHIEEIESGRNASPRIYDVKALATALSVTIDSLVEVPNDDDRRMAEEMFAILAIYTFDLDLPIEQKQSLRWALELARMTINKLPKDAAIQVLEFWLRNNND